MSPEEADALLSFRARYPGLSWEQLGKLFGIGAHQARHAYYAAVGRYVRRAA